MTQDMESNVLVAKGITKKYGEHTAVDNVSLSIKKGECLGLVGESGSGKSTLAKCLLMLEPIDKGEIWLNDEPVHHLKTRQMLYKRKEIQAVFQNPAASLNPKLKIIDSLMEPFDYQKQKRHISFLGEQTYKRREIAEKLLELVHMQKKYLDFYPHELSGGQKQRVVIAKAISIEPSLIILDEPTASLDVSIQAKILNLLKDLQEELNLSYLFISHDIAAVSFISDRVAVMQQGIKVDECDKHDLFRKERHLYTKQLISVYET